MRDVLLAHSEEAEFETVMKFRRYFTTYPDPQFRKRFPGRLENIDFGDVVFDDAVATLRNAINERHDANWSGIQPADGIRGIHLDYLESKESNALAFYVDDLACIAITDAAIRTVLEIAERLASSIPVKRLLGVSEEKDISELTGTFFTMIMQVLSSHETGHIFHGHCFETARVLPLLEATESTKPCFSYNVENTMRLQGMEVEADGYAAHMVLRNLFDGTMGKAIAKYTDSSLTLDEFIMTFALISIGGMFYLWSSNAFEEERVEHCDHPFGLMRMNVFMTDINGWCETHHPSLVGWGTLDKFQEIMEAVSSTGVRSIDLDVWRRQGAFILSPEGENYRNRLYAKQRAVREDMKPHRWYLLSELQSMTKTEATTS